MYFQFISIYVKLKKIADANKRIELYIIRTYHNKVVSWGERGCRVAIIFIHKQTKRTQNCQDSKQNMVIGAYIVQKNTHPHTFGISELWKRLPWNKLA